MQILSLSLRGAIGVRKGIGADEANIDFAQFDKGLIAFVGENGSGKSSLMESLTPFPELMSKSGSLYDHFCLRDSHRIVRARMYGAEYEFKLLIDPQARKTEAYVFRDGVPVNDGKMSTYMAAITKLFGTKELFKRSVFRAQNATSFASLTAGDRKKLFVELLGIDRIAKYHEIAKRKFTEAEREVETLRAKGSAIMDTAGDPDMLANVVNGVRAGMERRTEELTRARADLAEAEAALKAAKEAQQAIENLRQTAREARQRANDAKAAYEEAEREFSLLAAEHMDRKAMLDTRKATAQKYIDGRPKITEALETMDALRKQSEDMDAQSRIGFEKKAELDAAMLEAQRDVQSAQHEYAQATDKAAAIIRALEKEATIHETSVRLANEKIAELEKRTALLSSVPCAGTPMNDTCQLLMSARDDLAAIPKVRREIEDFDAFYGGRKDELDKTMEIAASEVAETKSALESVLASSSAKTQAAAIAYDEVVYDPIAHREIVGQLSDMEKQDWPRHKANADAAEEQLAQIDAEYAALEEQRKRQSEASAERTRRAKTEMETLDVYAAGKELEAMNADVVDTLQLEASRYSASAYAQASENGLTEAQRELTAAETRLQSANEAREKAAAILAEQRTAEKKMERLAYIVRATGKNGIQALELDASGPNVSAIANQLLADTFGSEFQIAFDTTALSADGKKELDTFDIRVSRGTEGEQPVEYLSVGQQVWVDSAIMQAIAIYLRQQSELDLADSFLDEADGALNSENAFLYLQMIRAAQNMSGVHHTFMVTHRQELLALIPQQIRLSKERGLEIFN